MFSLVIYSLHAYISTFFFLLFFLNYYYLSFLLRVTSCPPRCNFSTSMKFLLLYIYICSAHSHTPKVKFIDLPTRNGSPISSNCCVRALTMNAKASHHMTTLHIKRHSTNVAFPPFHYSSF